MCVCVCVCVCVCACEMALRPLTKGTVMIMIRLHRFKSSNARRKVRTLRHDHIRESEYRNAGRLLNMIPMKIPRLL